MGTKRAGIFSTVFISFIPLACCTPSLDPCFSDPRVTVNLTSCTPTRRYLHLPGVNYNPNHALHESVWIASHFLRHCLAENADTTTVVFPLDENESNLRVCAQPEDQIARNEKPLKWGACVVLILSKILNIPVVHSVSESPQTSCGQSVIVGTAPKEDILKTFELPLRSFSTLSFYSRLCYPGASCDGGAYVPLPERYIIDALEFIRTGVLQYFEISTTSISSTRKVRVLLYDRGDTARRRWVNADTIIERLRGDNRVELRYIRMNPLSLRNQVELYSWADLHIAPHGAALANTVFMSPGTDVVEILGNGVDSIKGNQHNLKRWTGELSHLLQINVAYVPCYLGINSSLLKNEIYPVDNGRVHDLPRVTRVDEVFDVVEPAIQRQTMRIQSLNESQISEPASLELRNTPLNLRGLRLSYSSAVFLPPISLFSLVLLSLLFFRVKKKAEIAKPK